MAKYIRQMQKNKLKAQQNNENEKKREENEMNSRKFVSLDFAALQCHAFDKCSHENAMLVRA